MKRKTRNYWNKERCKKIALLCKTKSELRKKYKSVYNSSYHNNWLDEICCHMEKYGNKQKRCIYVYEFFDNFVYIGLTYNIVIRNNHHLLKGPVYEHIKKCNVYNFLQLTDYINIETATILEDEYINMYKNNGWILLNSKKGGCLGSLSYVIFSKDECKEKSSICNTKTEFRNKFRKYYDYSRKMQWIDEICCHMINPNTIWTKEKCSEESKKYLFRSEFKLKCRQAYRVSCKNKWLNEICSHMKRKQYIKCCL